VYQTGMIDEFVFMRGKARSVVKLTEIRTIQFNNDNAVMVRMKNGKTADGKLPDSMADEIKGFEGSYEKGDFFLPIHRIKEIRRK